MAAGDGKTMTYHLNRKAGSLDSTWGIPLLDAQGAANKWAGTSGLGLAGALNVKAGITNPANYLDVQGVLNYLAGTSGLGENEAAARIA